MSLGGLPMANLVVLQLGVAVAMVLVAVDTALWPVSAAAVLLTALAALARWRGRWFTQWAGLTAGYLARPHTRNAQPPAAEAGNGAAVTGPEDVRVALLRVAMPDLVVAQGSDHDRRPVGLSWHQGTWTAVLLVEPPQAMVQPVLGAPNLPLGALGPCLQDRGVVLDAIGVIWHCYPGSVSLPPSSPALASYLEVLGPLPAMARRTTWVTVRIDPMRCPAAVRERGGGVVGAHRALMGAVSRVHSALRARGVHTRPLDADELLRAGMTAAELRPATSSPVVLRERWSGVSAGGVGHASYAMAGWPHGQAHSLNALTGVRTLSTTVALSLSPSGEPGHVGLRGLVRLSARTPQELAGADQRLRQLARRMDLPLTPLRGLQLAGFAATLPLGGPA